MINSANLIFIFEFHLFKFVQLRQTAASSLFSSFHSQVSYVPHELPKKSCYLNRVMYKSFLKVTTHPGVTAAYGCHRNMDATERQVIHYAPDGPHHYLHLSGVSVTACTHLQAREGAALIHTCTLKNIKIQNTLRWMHAV